MSKKIYISSGHGGSDPGAVANGLKEKDLNLKTAYYMAAYLTANGYTVKRDKTVDGDKSITAKTNEANAWGADAAFDVHFNAGKGDGWESYNTIFESASQGDELAEAIEKQVIAIGQQSRGTKTKANGNQDYFGFIRQTNMPGIILEGAFIDNLADIQDFDSNAELKKLGEAYAKGVIYHYEGTVSSTPVPTPTPTPSGKLVVDGEWGKLTTTALQKKMGTVQDGIISGQMKGAEKYIPADYGTFEFNNGSGSLVIKALQKKLNSELVIDGYFGTNSIKALQKFLGVTADGICGVNTTKALQTWLNS